MLSGGTEIYGRVKVVRDTSIVTEFVMLMHLPLFPVKSYYHTGSDATQTIGIPGICGISSTTMQGAPLAKIDRISATMAYFRCVIGVVFAFGLLITLAAGTTYLANSRVEAGPTLMGLAKVSVVVIGAVVGGIATYLIPTATRREVEIRASCHEVLGIAVDPARLPLETARHLLVLFSETRLRCEAVPSETSESIDGQRDLFFEIDISAAMGEQPQVNEQTLEMVDDRQRLLQDLVCVRAKLAEGVDCREHEKETDDILSKLRQQTPQT